MLGIIMTLILLFVIGIFLFVAFVLSSGIGVIIAAALIVVVAKHIYLKIKEKS